MTCTFVQKLVTVANSVGRWFWEVYHEPFLQTYNNINKIDDMYKNWIYYFIYKCQLYNKYAQ